MNDDEAPEQQLDALKAEHRQLDELITEMTQSGVADQLELARLKRRKLRLKDQIQLIVDNSIPDDGTAKKAEEKSESAEENLPAAEADENPEAVDMPAVKKAATPDAAVKKGE